MTWNLSSAMHLTNCSRVVAVVEVLPHCLQENPKQMVVKLEQKWKPKDNACLLFALWGMMSYEQRMVVTLGGKYQFMHVVQDDICHLK